MLAYDLMLIAEAIRHIPAVIAFFLSPPPSPRQATPPARHTSSTFMATRLTLSQRLHEAGSARPPRDEHAFLPFTPPMFRRALPLLSGLHGNAAHDTWRHDDAALIFAGLLTHTPHALPAENCSLICKAPCMASRAWLIRHAGAAGRFERSSRISLCAAILLDEVAEPAQPVVEEASQPSPFTTFNVRTPLTRSSRLIFVRAERARASILY